MDIYIGILFYNSKTYQISERKYKQRIWHNSDKGRVSLTEFNGRFMCHEDENYNKNNYIEISNSLRGRDKF